MESKRKKVVLKVVPTKRRQKRSGNVGGKGYNGTFVPDRMKVNLRLEGQVENAASVTYAESEVRINDMFDPQGGSGAAQCTGFDHLATLYTRYRVLKSKITVIGMINSASTTPTATAMSGRFVVYPSTTVTGATTVADGMSMPFAKMKELSAKSETITMSTSVAKFVGSSVTADRLQALVSASPSQILYWHVGVISRAYTNVLVMLNIRVDYEVEFFGRAQLDRSSLDLIKQAYILHCKKLILEERSEKKQEKSSEERLMELSDAVKYQILEKKK